MTEQEAIEILKSLTNTTNTDVLTALDIAIKAVDNQVQIKNILSTPTLFAEKFDRIRKIEHIYKDEW